MLDEIEAEINRNSAHVKCFKLSPVTKSDTELVKQGQDEKQKEYRCIIKVQVHRVESFLIQSLLIWDVNLIN